MDETNRNLSPKSTATDPAVWAAFSQNFRQVQSVLDRNRLLIQQVNDNHQSKLHDNLVQNVSLIQEINGNISKVVSMYSDLSSNFSTVCHKHHAANNTNSSDKR
ncbi:protein EARLY FLOWERING 4-like [Salvia splendens]|uniref:protein EARLY FLOWERING 4-like n=1 Tax=Salvia splendens TaxID=180675 RepID=UPI001C271457|nr:protein EARLY FLOWERING 4-like [Salvia splendens]